MRCNGYRLCHLKRKFSNKIKGKPRPTTCASPSKCGRLWAAGELAAASLSCTATPQGLQPIEAFHVVVTTASHQSTQPCRLHAVRVEKLLLRRRQSLRYPPQLLAVGSGGVCIGRPGIVPTLGPQSARRTSYGAETATRTLFFHARTRGPTPHRYSQTCGFVSVS